MPLRVRFANWIGRRVFYGWVMLAIGFLGMFGTGPGQSYTVGPFFVPLVEELSLSNSMLSLTYGLGTAIAALGLPYTGRLIDRYGQRRMIAAITGCLGLVCVLFPLVSGVIGLFVAFTAVRFFGQGSLTIASTNLVSQWFVRRRGFALSITALGFAFGLAAYPPAVQYLIDSVGWRNSWIWLGGFVWVLIIPPALLLVVNRPDEIGVVPDGAQARPQEGQQGEEAPELEPEEESWTRNEAVRTWTFWVIAVALAIPAALITGMYIYHVAYFEEQGLSAQVAVRLLSLTSVAMVVAMLTFGQLLDRFTTRYVVAGGILLNAVAMGVMLIARDVTVASIYAVLLGASSGAMMTNANYVWPRYFGRRHLGGIQGQAYTVTIIGASLGALPFGVAYDLTGSYRLAVASLALLPLAFGVAVMFMKPPRKAQPAAEA